MNYSAKWRTMNIKPMALTSHELLLLAKVLPGVRLMQHDHGVSVGLPAVLRRPRRDAEAERDVGHGHDDHPVPRLGVLGDAREGGLGHGVPEEEEKLGSGSGSSTAGRSRRCFMLGPAAAVTGDDQAAAAGAREAAPPPASPCMVERKKKLGANV